MWRWGARGGCGTHQLRTRSPLLCSHGGNNCSSSDLGRAVRHKSAAEAGGDAATEQLPGAVLFSHTLRTKTAQTHCWDGVCPWRGFLSPAVSSQGFPNRWDWVNKSCPGWMLHRELGDSPGPHVVVLMSDVVFLFSRWRAERRELQTRGERIC